MPYVPAVFNDTRTAVVQSWPRRSFRGGRGRDLDQILEFVKIENHHLPPLLRREYLVIE